MIRALIRLYPAAFRARYGRAMNEFHAERVRDGLPLWSWLRIVFDHVASALSEHARLIARQEPTASPAGFMVSVSQDLRYALRSLARRRGFAAVVLATIAIGVGVNTAIFSLIHGILLRPLPYPEAERLVSFGHEAPQWLLSQPEYLDYKNGLRSFETLAAFTQNEGNLASEEEPERVYLASVTLDFFAALGVRPLLGRVFAADEDVVAPAEVVILSHSLWRRRFAGDPAMTGRTITLNGRSRNVVGVMPPNFDYPQERTDIWLPLRRLQLDSLDDRSNHYLFAVGRLRRGAPLARASAEAHAFARRMAEQHADRYDPKYPLTPVLTRVGDELLGSTRPYLWALYGAVGFVLLIVCANVANLLLARGEGRRKEMALRGALGASRARLITQMLGESMVLGVTGGAFGVLLAWSLQRLLIALSPLSIPRVDEISLNWIVLAYALGVSLLAAVLFGVVPALRVSREAPGEMLKLGGRSQHEGSSRRVRQSLVIAEVALAVTTLSGAGLLLRSLMNLQSAPLGFEPQSVLTAKVSLTPNVYEDARAAAFFSQLIERVRALPGVSDVGAAGWLPAVESGGLWGVLAEHQSYDVVGQGPTAVPQQVTPGYFAAMRIPLMKGRDFTERDRAGGPNVGIISEAMARELWPDSEPIGQRFRLGGGSTFVTVVGIVGDIRARGFADTPEPMMYFPYAQTAESAYFMPRRMSLVIRTAGKPVALAAAVRDIVRSLDPTAPVSRILTLDDVVGTSIASRRFSTTLIVGFSAIALLLAGIGIFGVVAYGVSLRSHEIGVRVALGAGRATILRLVIADSTRMAVAGMLVGLLGAVAIARVIRSLLVDVPWLDVRTLLAVCATLAAVVVIATLLPARRAASVDPTDALRG